MNKRDYFNFVIYTLLFLVSINFSYAALDDNFVETVKKFTFLTWVLTILLITIIGFIIYEAMPKMLKKSRIGILLAFLGSAIMVIGFMWTITTGGIKSAQIFMIGGEIFVLGLAAFAILPLFGKYGDDDDPKVVPWIWRIIVIFIALYFVNAYHLFLVNKMSNEISGTFLETLAKFNAGASGSNFNSSIGMIVIGITFILISMGIHSDVRGDKAGDDRKKLGSGFGKIFFKKRSKKTTASSRTTSPSSTGSANFSSDDKLNEYEEVIKQMDSIISSSANEVDKIKQMKSHATKILREFKSNIHHSKEEILLDILSADNIAVIEHLYQRYKK